MKPSSGSTVVSPLTLMVITLEVSAAAKVTLPLGSVPAGEVGRVGRIRAAAGDRVIDGRRAAGVAAAGHGEGKRRAAGVALRLAGVGGRNGQRGSGVSSLRIVPVAVAVVIVAPTGLESVTVKPSSGSTVVSPLTLTVITLRGLGRGERHAAAGKRAPGEVGRVGRIRAAAGDRVVDGRDAAGVAAAGHGEGERRAAGVAFRLAGVGGRDGQRGS